jgi:hypothetical protein
VINPTITVSTYSRFPIRQAIGHAIVSG